MSESNLIESVSVVIKPADSRCRFWAKIVRAGTALPMPSTTDGANDLPGAYARHGDEEIFPGDFLFTGEENHHVKNRGWSYSISFMRDGKLIRFWNPGTEEKAKMKEAGLPKEFLAGAGGVAAMCRMAHAIRLGIAYE